MKKSIHTKERAGFVKKLKQARVEAELSQVDVAEKLGSSQSWVSKIELGELRVEATMLSRLARLYGKKIDYFL